MSSYVAGRNVFGEARAWRGQSNFVGIELGAHDMHVSDWRNIFFEFNVKCYDYTLFTILNRIYLTTLQGRYHGVQDAMTTMQALT